MDLVTRAKNIILQPKDEWPVIAAEPATVADLYKGYILPLAAIQPIVSFVKLSLIGISMPMMGTYREPLGSSIGHALVTYALALAAVYVLALVIEFLAPRFGGMPDRMQALKLAAYSYTPAWIGSVLILVPWIGYLLAFLASIYGLYLLYIGLPVLMRSAPEKNLLYFAAVLVVTIVISIVIGLITAAIGGSMMNGGGMRGAAAVPGFLFGAVV
jgi:hypothetical protein